MTESVENSGMLCSLPFYDINLSKFASSLPFDLTTKFTSGRGGHNKKKVTVNKFLLRLAYKNELDKSLIFRDKAVCQVNYLFLNGSLNGIIDDFCSDHNLINSDFGKLMHFSGIKKIFIEKRNNWKSDDNWIGNVAINALIIWSLAKKFNHQ